MNYSGLEAKYDPSGEAYSVPHRQNVDYNWIGWRRCFRIGTTKPVYLHSDRVVFIDVTIQPAANRCTTASQCHSPKFVTSEKNVHERREMICPESQNRAARKGVVV